MITESQVRQAFDARTKRSDQDPRILGYALGLLAYRDALPTAPREGAAWDELVLRIGVDILDLRAARAWRLRDPYEAEIDTSNRATPERADDAKAAMREGLKFVALCDDRRKAQESR